MEVSFISADSKEAEASHNEIVIARAEVAESISWLFNEIPIFETLIHHFSQDEKRITKLLRAANINRHGFNHQQRVAGIAVCIGRHLELPEHEIEALGLAASFHDMGYVLPAGKKPEDMRKKDYADHANVGAELFARLAVHPEFSSYFSRWTPEMSEIAYLAIKYHNGRSTEDYTKVKDSVPLASKLVRLADKSDNVRERIDADMLTPDIREKDKYYKHRLVPACIEEVRFKIVSKALTLQHVFSTDGVAAVVGDYSPKELKQDFEDAYGDSMKAAEEVEKSF